MVKDWKMKSDYIRFYFRFDSNGWMMEMGCFWGEIKKGSDDSASPIHSSIILSSSSRLLFVVTKAKKQTYRFGVLAIQNCR